jgi:Rrf2 family protein
MVASSKLAVALHVLTALAYNDGTLVTSERLAESVNTNPVVIRRILSELSQAGIVEARRGKSGGATLARPASSIRLVEVYRAVDGMVPFCLPARAGNPQCPVAACMPGIVNEVIHDIDHAIEERLGKYTVADLVARVS